MIIEIYNNKNCHDSECLKIFFEIIKKTILKNHDHLQCSEIYFSKKMVDYRQMIN